MIGLVASLAVGMAVIRHGATRWGTSEVATIAPAVLLATNILAWFQDASRQRFWVGFGLSGWAYLMFVQGWPLADHLPTAAFLDRIHDRLYANVAFAADDFGFNEGPIAANAHRDAFRRAGQSLFSLLFALLGGLAAIILAPAKVDDDGPLPPEGSILKPGWKIGEDFR